MVLTLMSPEKLQQLEKDLKTAELTLAKVTSRVYDTLLRVKSKEIMSFDDRSNIIAILKANGLVCQGSSLISSTGRKDIVLIVTDAT